MVDRMHEIEEHLPRGAFTLAGALTTPRAPGPWPVVLCLHGTGPLDRNEDMRGQRLAVFDTFARRLAEVGVATLRYDKRGAGKSGGSYLEAGQTELLADATAWLDRLAADARFTRRFALGHSEGTLLAARLSLACPLDGLALLMPFVQPAEALLLAQADHVEAIIRARRGLGGALGRGLLALGLRPSRLQRRLVARIRASERPTLRHFGVRVPARSLRELMAIDPAAVYAAVRVPTLLVGGAKDVQCDPADVHVIARALGPLATAVVIDDLTHVLRRHAGPVDLTTHARLLGAPIDPEVLSTVTTWIGARAARADGASPG